MDTQTSEAGISLVALSVPQPITPMDLLLRAIEKGTPTEQIDKLLDLQVSWDAKRLKFLQALMDFKEECPLVLEKDKNVAYGNTKYKHTTLGAAIVIVNPLLQKNGFVAAWKCHHSEGTVVVTCTLSHLSGHVEMVTLSGPVDKSGNKNDLQGIGSSITYLERYTLLAILGIVSSDDDDGRGASRREISPESEEKLKARIENPQIKNLFDQLQASPRRRLTTAAKYRVDSKLIEVLERHVADQKGR